MVKRSGSVGGNSNDRPNLCRTFALALIVGTFAYPFFQLGLTLQTGYLPTIKGLSDISSTTTTITSTESTLPTCKSMMQDRHSPFRDGNFLTRHTVPVSWHPREDASRELRHSMCQLHRYTAEEAKQCLQNKHVNFIGDSLTRYQYLSLAWFLHKGSYPPRFERSMDKPCHYTYPDGQEACSPINEPNVCMESDWVGDIGDGHPFKSAWTRLMQAMGGKKYFDGYMESNSVRDQDSTPTTIAENYFYATPPNPHQKQVFLSFNSEIGWSYEPQYPMHGFKYTGCAFQGTCDYTDQLAEERLKRAEKLDFDFSEVLEDAIGPSGVLRRDLPPVNITLYNRGLWGALSEERAQKLMPLLHNFSQGENGRCYYRTTTGRFIMALEQERSYIWDSTLRAGCGYIDVAHLVEDFNKMLYVFPHAPDQEYGNVQDEREYIYMDSVHFKPWVYEELNNMLLNVLCNNA